MDIWVSTFAVFVGFISNKKLKARETSGETEDPLPAYPCPTA